MIIKKDNSKIKYLYHYTPKENVESIMSSGVIKSKDQYTFFTNDYYKSINLFENEMMSNKFHITIDKVLERRSYASPEDYRIIKIPYHNDGNFVRMIFDHQKRDSIYHISTIHKGNLYFDKEKAEVLEIPVQKGNLYFTKFFSKLAFLMTVFMNPILAKADSWLDDPSYYSTEWFNPDTYDTTTNYTLRNAKQVAGLSYLSNIEGYTFEGKRIYFDFPERQCTSSDYCNQLLDMTAHDWVYLATDFKGRFYNEIDSNGICGKHLLILCIEDVGQVQIKRENDCNVYCPNCGYSPASNPCAILNSYSPGYYSSVTSAENGTVSMQRKGSIANKTVTFELIPDYGYTLESFTVKDQSNNIIETTKISDNKYTFKMPKKKVNINASFTKSLFTINVSLDHASIDPEGPLEAYYLDNKTFVVQADIGYEVKGYQINDGELITINESQFEITVDQNMTIHVIVEPIDYTLVDESKEKEHIFSVKEPFDEITKIDLCLDNQCETLEESEYEVEEQKIILKRELSDGDYTLNVSFSNEKTSTIDFSVQNKETPNSISPINPNTKTNLILLLIMLPIFFLGSYVVKKNQTIYQK